MSMHDPHCRVNGHRANGIHLVYWQLLMNSLTVNLHLNWHISSFKEEFSIGCLSLWHREWQKPLLNRVGLQLQISPWSGSSVYLSLSLCCLHVTVTTNLKSTVYCEHMLIKCCSNYKHHCHILFDVLLSCLAQLKWDHQYWCHLRHPFLELGTWTNWFQPFGQE